MKQFLVVVAHLFSLGVLLLLIVLPDHQLSWMQDIDPSMSELPADTNAESRLIVGLLLLSGIVILQLILVGLVKNIVSRVFSIAVIVATLGIGVLKFLV